jgi:hypothetical protein
MRTHVRFASTLFSPRQPEAGQVNPGRYGRALATWLAGCLRRRGVAVAEPAPEDWGWLLEAEHAGARLRIPCGNVVLDGPEGALVDSDTEWLVWVEARPERPLDRLRGRDAGAAAAEREVVRLVDACLRAEPSVTGIEWHAVDARLRERDHAPHPE